MLLDACQMVAIAYNLDNDFARIMEIIGADQSASLSSLFPPELHNLHESEGKWLTGMHMGHQLGPAPENARVLQGQEEGHREPAYPRGKENPPEFGRSLFHLLPLCSCNATKDGCFSSCKILDGNSGLTLDQLQDSLALPRESMGVFSE